MNTASFKLTPASIAMVVGGLIVFVGWFLPWASVGGQTILGMTVPGVSVSGSVFSFGVLALLAGLAAAACGVAFALNIPQLRMVWIGAAVAGVLTLLILLVAFMDLNRPTLGAKPSLGIGFFLTGIGAVACIAGAVLAFMAMGKRPAGSTNAGWYQAPPTSPGWTSQAPPSPVGQSMAQPPMSPPAAQPPMSPPAAQPPMSPPAGQPPASPPAGGPPPSPPANTTG